MVALPPMAMREDAPSNFAVAQQLAKAGLPIFPCKEDKTPLVRWKDEATSDPDRILKWWRQWPSALVGLRTGGTSGAYVVDLDIDKETGELVGELTIDALGLGDIFETVPAVRTPSGGWHLLFRHPGDGFGNTARKIGPGVDTRGEGGYIIAPGVASGSGKYEAVRPIDWAALPDLPSELRAIVAGRSEETERAPFTPTPLAGTETDKRIRSYAEAAINAETSKMAAAPEGARNNQLNDSAFRIGQMVGAGWISRSEAESALIEAGRHAGLPDKEISKTLRSALDAGEKQPRALPENRDTMGSPEHGKATADRLLAGHEAQGEIPRGNIVLMDRDEPYEPGEEIVRDTIPAIGVGFLGGQSGAFKSFLAIDLSFAIMTGSPFVGRKVERPGGVLYCAFEGAGTIKGRVRARRSRLPDRAARLPFMRLENFGSVASDTDFKAFDAEIERARKSALDEFGVPLRAVIIDTVTAAGMIGDDKENDPAAWQRVFDRLNPLSRRIEAPVVLVHHYGKTASAGLRGSSNARAGGDFVLAMTCDRDEVTGDTSNHYLALTKSRTAPEGGIAAVKPVEVEIGTREDGTAATSLVLDFDLGTKLKTAKRPTKALQSFMAAFDEALASEGQSVRIRNEANAPQVRAVRLAHVRDEFAKRYVTGSSDDQKRADTLRKQFKNALEQIPPTIILGAWDGIEWAWRLTAGSKSDAE